MDSENCCSLTSDSIYTSLSRQDPNNNITTTTTKTGHKKATADHSSGDNSGGAGAVGSENCCHVLVTSLAASQVRVRKQLKYALYSYIYKGEIFNYSGLKALVELTLPRPGQLGGWGEDLMRIKYAYCSRFSPIEKQYIATVPFGT